MQFLATAEEMRQADAHAIKKLRIPGLVLMENAGRGFVDVLEQVTGSVRGKHVVVVCGKGNNGGDGFVIARHLAIRGALVSVVLLCKQKDLKGDARINFTALSAIVRVKGSGITLQVISSSRQFSKLPSAELIVDAIFGTGFSGTVKGIAADAIRWINRQSARVASVDIPSGVDANSGTVRNVSVKARLTVAMGMAKVGHYLGEGRTCSGEVIVVDIGVPEVVYRQRNTLARIHAGDVGLPSRPHNIHKYSAGKVLVVAGSRAYTGAPVLTALAAMRAGAGFVRLVIPESIHGIVARKLTEVVIAPVKETVAGSISPDSVSEVIKHAKSADVVILGPGLSLEPETQKAIRSMISGVTCTLILDADALTAISNHKTLIRRRTGPTILTPHVGELSRLTGVPAKALELQRAVIAGQWSRKLHSVVVFKGSPTLTASLNGKMYLNSTGNPGMATAGSGDVLCGVIAALVAGGMEPTQAAYSGVFIHGMAGDLAVKRLGQRSLMAMNVLKKIPASLLHMEKLADEKASP